MTAQTMPPPTKIKIVETNTPTQRFPETCPGAPNSREVAKKSPAAAKIRPKIMRRTSPPLDGLVTAEL
jgi:hypothetical protein